MKELQNYLCSLDNRINRVKELPPAYQNFLLEEISDICLEIITFSKIKSICNITEIDIKQNPLECGEIIQNLLKGYDMEGYSTKPQKVFISHSSKDSKEINALVLILEDIGFNEHNLFCSSVASYGVPLGEDIYSYLKGQFQDFDLHVIYLLSQNYYDSAACLNEMGAAWVLSCSQTAFLLPDFEYQEIKGAINPNRIGIKFQHEYTNDELYNLKARIDEFKEEIGTVLGNARAIGQWEKRRDSFIKIMSDKE